MTKNPIIEQLIDAQLEFLDQEFSSADTIQNEFIAFYHWFRKQSLKNLWSFPQINDLLQKQMSLQNQNINANVETVIKINIEE